VQQALVLLERIPDSRDKVYAAIPWLILSNLFLLLMQLGWKPNVQSENKVKAEELINKAVLIARRLKDTRSESFALVNSLIFMSAARIIRDFKLDPTG